MNCNGYCSQCKQNKSCHFSTRIKNHKTPFREWFEHQSDKEQIMSNAEHYFENLIYDGEDINGDLNKNCLSVKEQEAIETCYYYVLYSMFGTRENLNEFLKKIKGE